MRKAIKTLSNVHVCTSAGPNLKVLSTMSVGFDHLSLEELRKRCLYITIYLKNVYLCV